MTDTVPGVPLLAVPLRGLTPSQGTAGLTIAVKFTVPALAITLNCCGCGFCVPICHTNGGGVAGETLSVALGFTVSVTGMFTESWVVVLVARMLPVYVPAAKPDGFTCTANWGELPVVQ